MIEPSNDWDDYPAPLIPYTPTTGQVRDAYVRAMRNAFIASASEHEAEFDRWLDDDRAIAWERGYHRGVRDELQDLEPAGNPYRKEDADG